MLDALFCKNCEQKSFDVDGYQRCAHEPRAHFYVRCPKTKDKDNPEGQLVSMNLHLPKIERKYGKRRYQRV